MKPDQRKLAQDLYLNTDKTQQEIADILDVNRRTVYLWVRHGRWDEMKAAARQAPKLILQDIYNHITAVNDGIRKRDEDDRIPTMEEVEKLRKLVNITSAIQKRSTGSYIEAYQELLFFIAKRDQPLAQDMMQHTDDYIRGTFGDTLFMASRERDANIKDVEEALAKEEVITDAEPPLEAAAASTETPLTVSPETQESIPVATGTECDNNGIFCDQISEGDIDAVASSETAPSNECGPILPPGKTVGYPGADFSEIGIFPAAESSGTDASVFEQIMTLPPEFRPSPFIDGDIVWIAHPDHLENREDTYGHEWGPLKMGHSIRYYPDIDPARAA